jgi:hypothetical protein
VIPPVSIFLYVSALALAEYSALAAGIVAVAALLIHLYSLDIQE